MTDLRLASAVLSDVGCFAGRHPVAFHPRLTALVGPNNAGKTTVFRSLIWGTDPRTFHSGINAARGVARPSPEVALTVVAIDPASDAIAAAARRLGLRLPAADDAAQASVPATATKDGPAAGLPSYGIHLRQIRIIADLSAGTARAEPCVESGTNVEPSVSLEPQAIRQLALCPAYVGDLPPLLDEIELAELRKGAGSAVISTSHAATVARLVALGGGLPDPADDITCDELSDRVNRALEPTLAEIGLRGLARDLRIEVREDKLMVNLATSQGRLRPSNLGAGENWLLAFAIWLAAEVTSRHALLLLDEPAAHLDPRNQKRIRDYLWRLSERVQIVYSTHSPFMIDRRHPERLVMVDMPPGHGTLRRYQLGDRYAHLRAALGIAGADSFLFGALNLVVEGPSDVLYVEHFAERLGIFDPDSVHLIHAGGTGDVLPMVRLLRELHTNIAVLLDDDKGGRRVSAQLAKQRFLDSDRIVLLGTAAPGTPAPERAIEDFLDLDLLLEVVNDTHDLEDPARLTGERLSAFRKAEGPDPHNPKAPRWEALPVARAIGAWLAREAGSDTQLNKTAVALEYCTRCQGPAPAAIADVLMRVAQLADSAQVGANNGP